MGDRERSLEAPTDTSPASFNTIGGEGRERGGKRGIVSGGGESVTERLHDGGVITKSVSSKRKETLIHHFKSFYLTAHSDGQDNL